MPKLLIFGKEVVLYKMIYLSGRKKLSYTVTA
jgi:hypothetical protein